MRTLVLNGINEGSAKLIKTVMDSFGHPYDSMDVGHMEGATLDLFEEDGTPKYGSIVLTDNKLYNGEGSVWVVYHFFYFSTHACAC